ncbi:MAG: rubrerythrin family protein [Bacteroidales bacterium]|nr:MAG: rubrerythrin family protein [Bacteroidales bacterium]
MDKSIKGTQTEKNLLKAFAGESQAKNRYTFFSKKAKEEGFEQISELFMNTAMQEEQHAKIFFRFLEGGSVEITATYPAGSIGTTAENLKAAAMGEHEEWSDLYPHFAEIAEQEGFKKVATAFKLIAKIEKEHEERYKKLLERVESGKVFEREEDTEWVCRKCGHVHKGKKALKNCPVCNHPEAYFEEKASNY